VKFARVLKEVLWCLVTEGGISYRRIKLSYGLDDPAVEELRRELITTKRLAMDVDGERLVWAPERLPSNESASLSREPRPPLRAAAATPTLAASDPPTPAVVARFARCREAAADDDVLRPRGFDAIGCAA
jgi:hypothetical protein